MKRFADVLIVTGQGVYRNGRWYAEFKDLGVYAAHVREAIRIAREYRYTHVVLSGGYTQGQAPTVSEATGMLALLRELGVLIPAGLRLVLDEQAYDSAENLIFGLIAARLHLEKVPIRRMGVCNSWVGKKLRFFLSARELGVEDRFYFHGHAEWDWALDPAGARDGEAQQCALAQNDPLLLDPLRWEEKKRRRYHGAVAFENRLDQFSERFPGFMTALRGVRDGGRNPDSIDALRRAFASEVLL